MKRFVTGLITGILIASSISVFAASKIKSAVFAPDIKIEVNGKQISSAPISIVLEGQTNGSNYVGTKALAEALGATVSWDGATRKIIVTSGSQASTDTYTVTKVVDGDTFKVMYSGKETSVRLIGVDTPESVHPDAAKNTEFGKLAAEFTRGKLEGKTVKLEKDVSETDQNGRLLRYVFLEDGTFFNESLVKEGYAKAATYPPDVEFANTFVAAEKYARENNKGLWAIADDSSTPAPSPTPTPSGKIKGNISSSGEKIYHMAGGAYYDQTYAEEYFDTEEEAIAAGYRKSSR